MIILHHIKQHTNRRSGTFEKYTRMMEYLRKHKLIRARSLIQNSPNLIVVNYIPVWSTYRSFAFHLYVVRV